jgi:chemotaxis protein CheC
MINIKQKDAIVEIVNIGVGKGSAMLSQMIDEEILLNVPYVNVVLFDQILDELKNMNFDKVHTVEIKFQGEYKGMTNVILSKQSADLLVDLLMRGMGDFSDMDQIRDGILTEVGNIIINAIMGAFGNILEVPFDYETPRSYEGDIAGVHNNLDKEKFSKALVCRTNFAIRDKDISAEILIMYEINSFNKLKALLDSM